MRTNCFKNNEKGYFVGVPFKSRGGAHALERDLQQGIVSLEKSKNRYQNVLYSGVRKELE